METFFDIRVVYHLMSFNVGFNYCARELKDEGFVSKATPLAMKAVTVVAPKMNSFFKPLTEKLVKRVSMDYGKVKT